MKVWAEYGHFKVIERFRMVRSPKQGLRGEWTEYQVRFGRRVVARHELLGDAMRDAKRRNQQLWDEIGEQLRKGA